MSGRCLGVERGLIGDAVEAVHQSRDSECRGDPEQTARPVLQQQCRARDAAAEATDHEPGARLVDRAHVAAVSSATSAIGTMMNPTTWGEAWRVSSSHSATP